MQHKLFVVSNRLPITIDYHNGQYTCRQSSGGLVSAVSAYLKSEGAGHFTDKVWVGVPTTTEKTWTNAIATIETGDYVYSPLICSMVIGKRLETTNNLCGIIKDFFKLVIACLEV